MKMNFEARDQEPDNDDDNHYKEDDADECANLGDVDGDRKHEVDGELERGTQKLRS